MNQITLNVDNRHLSALLIFLKTLSYIEVKKVEKNVPMTVNNTDKLATLFSLYGAWKDDRPAESLIEDIQHARVFNRLIESL
jgi:hypothetical protein